MHTTRTAAALVAGLARPAGALPLLRALGFSNPVRLDRSLAQSLDLLPFAAGGTVARRPGILRAVTLVAHAHSVREVIEACALRLARHAPEFQWVLLVVARTGNEAGLSTFLHATPRPRRATLLVAPHAPRESDAETTSALIAAASGDDPLVHLRWHEILGREALSTRFYRSLERHVTAMADGAVGAASVEARRSIALATASRLLFLCFLEGRGWLDNNANFLAQHLETTGDRVQQRLLDPLFFGTLNTPVARRAARARRFGRVPFLNGGLFTRSPVERRHRHLQLRDTDIAGLFDDVLARYRFSAFEEAPDASEAAIDPEMLGRALESLMASHDRRASGTFFTPHALVTRTTEAALLEVLSARGLDTSVADALVRGDRLDTPATDAIHILHTLRVIDPACGSGAFLVHILDRLTRAIRAAGDPTPPALLKRHVLTRSIFGVDINPMAVWLCELRLWLAALIDFDVDDPLQLPPLPNLDRNIRVGDALDGGEWAPGESNRGTFARWRERYARATGTRKAQLARVLDREERRLAIEGVEARLDAIAEERWSLLTVARGRDLFGGRRGATVEERAQRLSLRNEARRLRAQRRNLRLGSALPFRFASHFADVVRAGGFDLVVGNPPWVRIHRIPQDRRDRLRETFRVARDAAWRGAMTTGPGFGHQVDLAALFAELSTRLLRTTGIAALLLPMKLWRSVSGGGVRSLLHGVHTLRVLEDWSEAPAAFDAAAYPSLVIAARRPPAAHDEVSITVHRQRIGISWRAPSGTLAFDGSPGAPWVTLPPDARRAFTRVADAGVPIADGRTPLLGVKCGCNDAFLVRQPRADGAHTIVGTTRGNVRMEPELLRPVLRGEQVRRWKAHASDERIVWTHGVDGRPLARLPEAAARWFGRWREALMARSDVRGGTPWWSLFRTDGAASDVPRVVWADMSRGPRALILPARSPVVPLNTCYVLRCRDDRDAATLAALFNSPLIAAWLDAIAEPARGGYRRYLGWTMSALPLPADWDRARQVLAPLALRAMEGESLGDTELLAAVCDAYRLSVRAMSPLIEWAWR